jgi:hypothetical protein
MFEQLDGKTKAVTERRYSKLLEHDYNHVLLSSEERSVCDICRKRKHTTVNGVCLDCAMSKKRVH